MGAIEADGRRDDRMEQAARMGGKGCREGDGRRKQQHALVHHQGVSFRFQKPQVYYKSVQKTKNKN